MPLPRRGSGATGGHPPLSDPPDCATCGLPIAFPICPDCGSPVTFTHNIGALGTGVEYVAATVEMYAKRIDGLAQAFRDTMALYLNCDPQETTPEQRRTLAQTAVFLERAWDVLRQNWTAPDVGALYDSDDDGSPGRAPIRPEDDEGA